MMTAQRVVRKSGFSPAAADPSACLTFFLRRCGTATTAISSPCTLHDHHHNFTLPFLSCTSNAAKFQFYSYHHNKSSRFHPARKFSTNKPTTQEPIHDGSTSPTQQPILIYESPFASLTLKLKRISLTSAVIGLVGLPALSFFYGSAGGVPPTGQLAVIATAGITAVGSTALLGYCFSPYVHTMEILSNGETEEEGAQRVRIVTRDIFARKVITVFDPSTDVSRPGSDNSRPFCNFVVNGMPFYIHPDLLNDDKLRM
ncbi:hypothetical protein ACHAW6_002472 [Cyclotella cf. meneghiniana]